MARPVTRSMTRGHTSASSNLIQPPLRRSARIRSQVSGTVASLVGDVLELSQPQSRKRQASISSQDGPRPKKKAKTQRDLQQAQAQPRKRKAPAEAMSDASRPVPKKPKKNQAGDQTFPRQNNLAPQQLGMDVGKDKGSHTSKENHDDSIAKQEDSGDKIQAVDSETENVGERKTGAGAEGTIESDTDQSKTSNVFPPPPSPAGVASTPPVQPSGESTRRSPPPSSSSTNATHKPRKRSGRKPVAPSALTAMGLVPSLRKLPTLYPNNRAGRGRPWSLPKPKVFKPRLSSIPEDTVAPSNFPKFYHGRATFKQKTYRTWKTTMRKGLHEPFEAFVGRLAGKNSDVKDMNDGDINDLVMNMGSWMAGAGVEGEEDIERVRRILHTKLGGLLHKVKEGKNENDDTDVKQDREVEDKELPQTTQKRRKGRDRLALRLYEEDVMRELALFEEATGESAFQVEEFLTQSWVNLPYSLVLILGALREQGEESDQ